MSVTLPALSKPSIERFPHSQGDDTFICTPPTPEDLFNPRFAMKLASFQFVHEETHTSVIEDFVVVQCSLVLVKLLVVVY